MRATIIALITCLASVGPALADGCKIEAWKTNYEAMVQALFIEGVTTCRSGMMQLQIYDGDGDSRKFVGVETVFIEGHIFETIIMPAEKPNAVFIKYTIATE